MCSQWGRLGAPHGAPRPFSQATAATERAITRSATELSYVQACHIHNVIESSSCQHRHERVRAGSTRPRCCDWHCEDRSIGAFASPPMHKARVQVCPLPAGNSSAAAPNILIPEREHGDRLQKSSLLLKCLPHSEFNPMDSNRVKNQPRCMALHT